MSAFDAPTYGYRGAGMGGGLVTFGVIEKNETFLGPLIALAFESAGHDCLVLRDGDHAARILNAIRLDSIVVDIQIPGANGVDWLEAINATWPDLPSRTLLLTHTALTSGDVLRIKRLGAEVAFRPLSIHSIKQLVVGRLRRAMSNPTGLPQMDRGQHPSVTLVN